MSAATLLPGHPVYIVDGARTPQIKARGMPGPFTQPTSAWPQDAHCCCVSLFPQPIWTK